MKKFMIKFLAIIILFLVLTSGKTVVLNTYFPNSNYFIEEHIKMYYANQPFHSINIDNVRVIDKVSYADRLAVLYEFEEEKDTKEAIIIYSLNERGKLMGSKGIRAIDGHDFDSNFIPFRSVSVEKGFKDVLFIYGNNEDGYTKASIERYLPNEHYEIPLEDGYFMKFVDIGNFDGIRVDVHFED